MQVKSTLKGLYWYFKYTDRLIIPFTKDGWVTLLGIARNFSDGVPQPMQFGNYVEFTGLVTEDEWKMAYGMIYHSHDLTVKYLATLGLFPMGEEQIIKHEDQEAIGYGPTLGWKRTFEWRPVC